MLLSASVNAPKLIVQAGLAGLYGSLLLVFVLWIANPGSGMGAGHASALLPVFLIYTLASALLWPSLYGVLRFFASHSLHLSWFSLRYVMAFHLVNTAVILTSCWTTLSRGRKVLMPATMDRLIVSGAAILLAWLYALVVTLVPRFRRTAWLQASAAGLALAALLAPVWSRPAGAGTPAPLHESRFRAYSLERRLILLNFDGADLEDILTLEAQGKLPTFSRLREEGSYGRLRTIVPCRAPVTRATLVTGKLPFRHGVTGHMERQVLGRGPLLTMVPSGIGFDFLLAPLLTIRPLSVSDRRSRALWEIGEMLGGTSTASGWDVDLDTGCNPPSVALGGEQQLSVADLIDLEAAVPDDRLAVRKEWGVSCAIEADEEVLSGLDRITRGRSPGVVALSFPGLDRVAHDFLRYARAAEFGNVSAAESARYGRVLERYYGRVDAIVERVMDASDEETILFVTSSHGIEPAALRRRLVAMAVGREAGAGTHDGGPVGFLFARGPEILSGHFFGKGSIADVVPTALYALGQPVARDLDGIIRTGIFTSRYTFENPVVVIDSYE